MTRFTVFTMNRSPAVRLPKPVALPDDVRQVEITKNRPEPAHQPGRPVLGLVLRRQTGDDAIMTSRSLLVFSPPRPVL